MEKVDLTGSKIFSIFFSAWGLHAVHHAVAVKLLAELKRLCEIQKLTINEILQWDAASCSHVVNLQFADRSTPVNSSGKTWAANILSLLPSKVAQIEKFGVKICSFTDFFGGGAGRWRRSKLYRSKSGCCDTLPDSQ